MKKHMRNSKTNNEPIRRDALTGEKHVKSDLLRINISSDGQTTIDKEQTMEGRGIYVHAKSKDKLHSNPNRLISLLKKYDGDINILEKLKEVL